MGIGSTAIILVSSLQLWAELPTAHSINALKGVSMGQIQSHTTRNLHQIKIANKEGAMVGRLEVRGFFHNYEDGQLNPIMPSGPANRKISHSLLSVSLSHSFGSGAQSSQLSETEQKQFTQMVKDLEANKGFKNSQGMLILADDVRFPDVFSAHIQSQYGWTAKFRESP